MYVTSYKINNSYTTYVIHDSGDDRSDNYTYRKPTPKLQKFPIIFTESERFAKSPIIW